MKLVVAKNNFKENHELFLRRKFSYIMINNRHTGKDSFVRCLTTNRYPRFHMYILENSNSVTFDIHLDQKEPSYKGTHAHNAEYDSQLVVDEIERLKSALGVATDNPKNEQKTTSQIKIDKAEDVIGSGSYDKNATPEKKKGFFERLFS